MALLVPVSWGELLDKITILEIKEQHIADPGRRANVRKELDALCAVRDAAGGLDDSTLTLVEDLRTVNRALWEIEDDLRECERTSDFGPRFVELARGVYHNNDRRAAIKRRINGLLGSELVEEKSYAAY